jgi:hypothetical protein
MVIITIGAIFIALWAQLFFTGPAASGNTVYGVPMPMFGVLENLTGRGTMAADIVAMVICTALIMMITVLNTSHFFIIERTFIPALVFILLIAILPQYQALNPVLPAAFFAVNAIRRMLDSYRKQGMAYNFFDAGIFMGTGSLFYANLIWLGTVVIIGCIIIRGINIKETALALLGLATPYIIMFGLYYALGYNPGELLSLIHSNLFAANPAPAPSKFAIATLSVVAVAAIFSLVHVLMFNKARNIKSRKTFSLLIWMFFITICVYVFVPSASFEIIWILGIPTCYFIAQWFVFSRKRMLPEAFFILLLLSAVLAQVIYVLQ